MAQHAARRRHDPRLVLDRAEIESGHVEQRMTGPNYRGHRLFGEPFVTQSGFFLTLEQAADHDVDLALRELTR